MIENNVTFGSPIPGQSLVTEPRGYAWERPPEVDKVEDAMAFYMNSLSQPQIADDIFTALDEGFPLDLLVKSILSNGVMEGIHSIDISLLIHPILVELVHAQATLGGLKNITLHAKNKKEEMDKKEKQMLVSRLQRAIDKMETPDEGTEILEQTQEFLEENRKEEPVEAPEEQEEEAVVEEKPMGLMARRGE
jgi:hypothetical protein|tara:strand:- start:86 stop:661 length:576 start_codon:yes stop_codon:yes gene_type:complete